LNFNFKKDHLYAYSDVVKASLLSPDIPHREMNLPLLFLAKHPYLLKRSCDLLAELGWSNLEAMRQRQKAILMFDPPYLSEMFTQKTSFQTYRLRSSKMNLELPKCRTNYYKNSFAFSGAKLAS